MSGELFTWDTLVSVALLMNVIFIIIVVFFERKDPSATLAWVMALVLLPVLGFILYLFLGQTFSKQKMFRVKKEEDQKLQGIIQSQISELKTEGIPVQADNRVIASLQSMVLMLLENNGAVLTANNRVRVFTDGKEKFASLIADIQAATEFVHLEYFIWKDDGIGNDLRVALTERARAGVEVRLLCDGLGCAALPRRFFDEFRSAGGKVAFFVLS
jgi:cardiolipin synthase